MTENNGQQHSDGVAEKTHADFLVVTVRAQEMASSINHELTQLAIEDDFFILPKQKLSFNGGLQASMISFPKTMVVYKLA